MLKVMMKCSVWTDAWCMIDSYSRCSCLALAGHPVIFIEKLWTLSSSWVIKNAIQSKNLVNSQLSQPHTWLITECDVFVCSGVLLNSRILVCTSDVSFECLNSYELYQNNLTDNIFFSVHKRAEFNKSCNLTGSGSGWNFPIWSAYGRQDCHHVDLFS